MEHTFDSEDMAIFYRSLLLLHSPKIDSQRKLYHLMNQSIRKHHPSSKTSLGKKHSELTCSEYSGLSTAENPVEAFDLKSNNEVSVSQRDPRINKESNSAKASNFSSRDPRSKIQSDNNKVSTQKSGNKRSKIKQQIPSSSDVNFSFIENLTNYKSTINTSQSSLESSSISQQNRSRISHFGNREIPLLKSTQKAATRNSTRHNYCPNPVNLKKIRAVLARGDPFPTHLTKACINNITPDLQREKL